MEFVTIRVIRTHLAWIIHEWIGEQSEVMSVTGLIVDFNTSNRTLIYDFFATLILALRLRGFSCTSPAWAIIGFLVITSTKPSFPQFRK